MGFLPCNNGQSCEMNPFGCGNLLVLNQGDYGVGMLLQLRMMVTNELSCYTINSNCANGVVFVLLCMNTPPWRMGIGWMEPPSALLMCSIDDKNHMMQCLYHNTGDYVYARVVNYNN